MWNKLLKKDSFVFGIVFGTILPVLFYLVLYLLDMLVLSLFESHMLAEQKYLYLVSLTINLFAIKYYFVNLNFDKTGRGVLIVTFAMAILYFIT